MAAIESLLSEDAGAKKRRIRMVISILIGVLLLHVAAGVIAGIFIVAKYIFPPPANFVVKKDVRLPAKKREQKMNMASLDAIAPKPTLSDKMQSTRPTAFSLPDVPNMPLDQMLPLDPSQLLSDQMASISNSEALGTASGASVGGSGGFGGKGLSFLGVDSSGQRILLMVDISGTVVNKAAKAGISPEKLREELIALISKLPITSRFSIIQYAGNYKPFTTELVPASQPNKTLALDWIRNEWVTSGGIQVSKKTVASPSGFIGVLQAANDMKPDAVFIITDGSYKSKVHTSGIPWDEIRKVSDELKDSDGRRTKINVIAFEADDEDLKQMKRMSQSSGGNLREMK
jgi:hypothetical protein